VISLPYDVGLSAGRNAMLDRVTTPYFVLLDDDFVFTPKTTLDRLLDVLERNANVDIVSGSLFLPGKENEPYSYAELLELDYAAKELRLRKGNRGALPNEPGCFLHDIVLNFFVARTDRIRRVRWDERLKLGEHQDFFIRAKQAGLVVVACPSHAVALHDQAHSDQNYKAKRMREFQYLKLMLEKHQLRKMRLSTGPVYVDLDR
jgi:GT2 family glycosyltransferase